MRLRKETKDEKDLKQRGLLSPPDILSGSCTQMLTQGLLQGLTLCRKGQGKHHVTNSARDG